MNTTEQQPHPTAAAAAPTAAGLTTAASPIAAADNAGAPPFRIGAIIPTFNRAASLKKILTCLEQQVFPDNSLSLVPIAVVDGSTDGTLEMLARDFPATVIVNGDGNWWYTRSINEGIKKAIRLGCNFILTLNDDIIFSADYINTLVNDYLRSGRGSVIGSVSLSAGKPCLITFSGVSKINFVLKEYNYIPKFTPIEEETLSGIKPSVVLSGRGILYPAEVFDRFGLYDERLVQYGPETDFTYTASCNGVKVMISYNARVYENINLTSAGAVYNNPSVRALIKSFGNKYSINSFRKTYYYSIKHRGVIPGSLIALWRTFGVVKNFALIKWRNKS
jgi:GT2 family glycosyltransferase